MKISFSEIFNSLIPFSYKKCKKSRYKVIHGVVNGIK